MVSEKNKIKPTIMRMERSMRSLRHRLVRKFFTLVDVLGGPMSTKSLGSTRPVLIHAMFSRLGLFLRFSGVANCLTCILILMKKG